MQNLKMYIKKVKIEVSPLQGITNDLKTLKKLDIFTQNENN